MTIKFSKIERVAGAFILLAIFGLIASMVFVAARQGWFDSKVVVFTYIDGADGVRLGTAVQMEGLKIGSVTQVELQKNRKVFVEFEVSEKFIEKVREDSVVRVVRPFVIGEKVLDVSMGTDEMPIADVKKPLHSAVAMDLMDFFSGRRFAPFVENLSQILENLKFIADAFADRRRSEDFVEIYDQLKPFMKNFNQMAKEVNVLTHSLNKDQKMVNALMNLTETSHELNQFLPTIGKQAPELTQNMSDLTKKLTVLVDEMNVFLPLMRDMGPELPKVGRRAVEALDETVVTLKALQKTFILKGASQLVREEESKKRPVEEVPREPAQNP